MYFVCYTAYLVFIWVLVVVCLVPFLIEFQKNGAPCQFTGLGAYHGTTEDLCRHGAANRVWWWPTAFYRRFTTKGYQRWNHHKLTNNRWDWCMLRLFVKLPKMWHLSHFCSGKSFEVVACVRYPVCTCIICVSYIVYMWYQLKICGTFIHFIQHLHHRNST